MPVHRNIPPHVHVFQDSCLYRAYSSWLYSRGVLVVYSIMHQKMIEVGDRMSFRDPQEKIKIFRRGELPIALKLLEHGCSEHRSRINKRVPEKNLHIDGISLGNNKALAGMLS